MRKLIKLRRGDSTCKWFMRVSHLRHLQREIGKDNDSFDTDSNIFRRPIIKKGFKHTLVHTSILPLLHLNQSNNSIHSSCHHHKNLQSYDMLVMNVMHLRSDAAENVQDVDGVYIINKNAPIVSPWWEKCKAIGGGQQ